MEGSYFDNEGNPLPTTSSGYRGHRVENSELQSESIFGESDAAALPLRRSARHASQNLNAPAILQILGEDSDYDNESEYRQRELNESELEDTSDGDISEMDEIISDENEESSGGAASMPGRRAKRGRFSQRTGGGKSFVWRAGDNFVPNIHDFDASSSGITAEFQVNEFSPESDYFLAYFDRDIMQMVADETNKYHAFMLGSVQYPPKSRVHDWYDIIVDELYAFLAVLMLMAHMKKGSVSDYWKTEKYLHTPQFGHMMSRDRFQLILRFIHFADNTMPNRDDRLWKIRTFMSKIINKFHHFFYPFNKVVIDESLVLFKGRLVFKQYIPSKRCRFGIKMFVLCDCETGMILDMIVYTGTDIDIASGDSLGFSGAVVKTMMNKYLGKGHSLYTDNFYTSPLLSDYLHENMTNSCGTVRKNRKQMPKFSSQQEKKTVELHQSENLLAMNWKDKRDVTLLTTMHSGAMVDSGKVDRVTKERVMKPDVVIDYTQNMRLVDKSDCQLAHLHCLRKSVKWYIKLFYHLVDVTLLNAYNMYLVKTGNKPKHRDFAYAVMTQLAEKYCRNYRRPQPQQQDVEHQPPIIVPQQQNIEMQDIYFVDDPPMFDDAAPIFGGEGEPLADPEIPLGAMHRPASGIGSRRSDPFQRLSGREEFERHKAQRMDKRKSCDLCALKKKKRALSYFMCPSCGVYLCIHPCYFEYHSKQ